MDTFGIRPLQTKDARLMLEWMKDPSITRFFRFDSANITMEDCRKFISEATRDANTLHYAVVDANDEYLGTVSLKNIDTNDGTAEYAISMRACAHGSGAAAQGTEEILKVAFDKLHLNRVYLNVLADNGRANAFYKKMDFMFERIEKNAVQINGAYHDLNWYATERRI